MTCGEEIHNWLWWVQQEAISEKTLKKAPEVFLLRSCPSKRQWKVPALMTALYLQSGEENPTLVVGSLCLVWYGRNVGSIPIFFEDLIAQDLYLRYLHYSTFVHGQPALTHLFMPPALWLAWVGVFSRRWIWLSREALGWYHFLFSGLGEEWCLFLPCSTLNQRPEARVYGL